MRVVNQAGPPPTPPGMSGYRRHRRRGGFWGNFAKAGIGMQLNIILSLIGFLLVIGYLVWRFILPHNSVAEAAEAPPTPAPIVIQTVPPLESPPSATPAQSAMIDVSPVAQILEPAQVEATATAHYLYSRPALAAPEASPYLVGVITYEPGCPVSNLGFTTAGMAGRPYYLYFQHPMDRDPLMQMVQVQGYVQTFKECQYPVLMVSQIFWLNDIGTPAPLGAYYTPITKTITGTVVADVSPWGALPTPNKYHTPIYRPNEFTPTPYPTYTPLPTATPYVPPPPATRIVYVTPDAPDPTDTPTRTPTPVSVAIYGDIVRVAGCQYTNLAVNDGQNNYLIEMNGAQLPAGDPADYYGMVSGVGGRICDGPSIKANQIIWYQATATPTSSPTLTPTVEVPTPTVEVPTPTVEVPTPTVEVPTPTVEVPTSTVEVPTPTVEITATEVITP